MDSQQTRKYGVYSSIDIGPPENVEPYTTIAILHGYGFTGGVFTPLIPFAKERNVRLILLNRRDYFGSTPYTDEDRAALTPDPNLTSSERLPMLRTFMRDRASELFDFLSLLVEGKNAPGGIILVGWSFGSNWITALLADIKILHKRNPEVRKYVKRLIIYDPPYHALGYPPPLDFYNPLQDPLLSPEERAIVFSQWVSGYYTHGETPSKLEYRTPVSDPRPTILTMTPEFVESTLCREPGAPGGSDANLMLEGIQCGLFRQLRVEVLSLSDADNIENNITSQSTDDWRDIEFRYVWCDRSVWEMPWCFWSLRGEIEREKANGKSLRNVDIVRIRGANHYAHWDSPERALDAFLTESSGIVLF